MEHTIPPLDHDSELPLVNPCPWRLRQPTEGASALLLPTPRVCPSPTFVQMLQGQAACLPPRRRMKSVAPSQRHRAPHLNSWGPGMKSISLWWDNDLLSSIVAAEFPCKMHEEMILQRQWALLPSSLTHSHSDTKWIYILDFSSSSGDSLRSES